MTSRVLVIGSVESKFEVFTKIAQLHADNGFAAVLLVGDLFENAEESTQEAEDGLARLLRGEIEVTVPTYFGLGSHAFPAKVQQRLTDTAGELCSNLFFLGRRSTMKTTEGLRIVSLGGCLEANMDHSQTPGAYDPVYSAIEANTLRGAHATDILITNSWPSSVQKHSSVKLPKYSEAPLGEDCLAKLCLALKPRYYFSTSPTIFYEREPFFYAEEKNDPRFPSITRFISLAAFKNPSKQRWHYAFSIEPAAPPPLSIHAGATRTPFDAGLEKRKAADDSYSFSRFSNHSNQRHERGHHRSKRQRAPPPGPETCFFCLANPNLNTHLIVSIGEESYLTTAKGPLPSWSTFPALPFPSHILIIPLCHEPTFASIAPPDTKVSTYKEMTRYCRAIQSFFGARSRGGLGTVCWEISRKENVHIHWQIMPAPVEAIKKGLVDAAFKVEAENEKYAGFKAKDIGDGSTEGGDFLRVWIWEPEGGMEATLSTEGSQKDAEPGGKEHSLVMSLKPEMRFDLQFARKVMAKLLQLEGRMHWKDCAQSDEEEKSEAESFKQAFRAFDFTLDDEA